MKNETAIKAFLTVMKNLGFKDIAVKPADPVDYDECKGAYEVGFMVQGRFSIDVDIVPGRITVTIPKSILNKRSRKIEMDGFIVTGYKLTRGTYETPPDVEDFHIGEYQTLNLALNSLVLYYVQCQLDNVWECAYQEEIEHENGNGNTRLDNL